MIEQKKNANPALGFLIMAGFNVLAAVTFIVFYFLGHDENGEKNFWLLIASLISIVAAAGLLFAYNYFKRKLSNS